MQLPGLAIHQHALVRHLPAGAGDAPLVAGNATAGARHAAAGAVNGIAAGTANPDVAASALVNARAEAMGVDWVCG